MNPLTATLVKALGWSNNTSGAVFPKGREDIVPLAAF